MRLSPVSVLGLSIALSSSLAAQSINVGSTGVHGAFNPQSNVVVDLATEGTYDPVNWRVVFHYTSVHIPAGVTVTFANHPSRAPVVWLSQTDIVIDGAVRLDGANAGVNPNSWAEPGPGGFRGGLRELGYGWSSSSGMGWGGGFQQQGYGFAGGAGGGHSLQGANAGGAIGGPAYGGPALEQLIGGSGGAAGFLFNGGGAVRGGGGGGGAILLAANNMVRVTGSLTARGGVAENGVASAARGGGGSGGALRLVAGTIEVSAGASISAAGGSGGSAGFGGFDGGVGAPGRVRLEANLSMIGAATSPPATTSLPGSVTPPASSPSVRVRDIGGVALPADPRASLGAGAGSMVPDLNLQQGTASVIWIETTHVPLNATIYLRVTGATGPAQQHLVTNGITNPLTELVPGAPDLRAQTSITLDLRAGYSALQARVVLP